MADERIRIIVEQQGVTEALTNLQDLKKALSDVNNQKATISTTSTLRSQLEGAARGAGQLARGLASAFDMSGNMAHKIGSAFTDMSKLFETNFIDVVERRMAYMFVDVLTGHLSDALKRADILNTFVPYMNLAGVSTDVAQEALNRVDLSIRGLPIGLDEAAQRLRRYQMFLGDTQRATDLTIGIQKAITAGGAPQSFKNMAYYMIDRLLTAGTLSTSRQWYSLINGLGVSVRFLAEAMGLGELSAAEFAAGLANGTYSVEQFLDAVVALGNGTASSAAKLDEALGIYKSTFESWLSNIGFAATRGTANVINAISEVLESNTGKKLTGYMEEVRDGINAMFSGIAEWVRANPDAIVRVVDSVRNLFGTIGGMGFGGIAKQVLENMARLFDYISRVIERLSGTNFGEFIAFATTLAGPIGSFMAKAASSLPIILGVFQRFKDFDFETLLDKIMIQVGAMATLIERVLRIIPDGILGDLMAFALVWGKPLAAVLRAVGTALSAIGSGHLLAGIKSVFDTLKGLFTFLSTNPIGLVITAITTAIAGIAISVQQAKKTHEEMLELANESLSKYSDFTEKMNQNTEAARDNTNAARENMDSLKEKSDDTKELVDELLRLNEVERDSDRSLFADTLSAEGDSLERMREIVGQLNAMYPEWNLAIDESTGHLTDNTIAILSNVDAMLAQAQLEAAQAALTTAYTDKYNLRASGIAQQSNLDELSQYLEVLERQYERIRNQAENNPYWVPSPGLPTREKYAEDAAYNYMFADGRRLGETIEAVKTQIEAAELALEENEKQQTSNELLITSLNAIIREDQDVAMSYDEVAASINSTTEAVDEQIAAIETAAKRYEELREAAVNSIDAILGKWGEFKTPENMVYNEKTGRYEVSGDFVGTIVPGDEARAKYLNDYDRNLEIIRDKIIADSNDLNLYEFVLDALEGGLENAPEVAAIVQAYQSGTLQAMVDAWSAVHFSEEQTADLIASTQEKFENIVDILKDPERLAERKRGQAIEALYAGLGEERASAILEMEEQNGTLQQVDDDAVAEIQETVTEITEAVANGKLDVDNTLDAAYRDGKEKLNNISGAFEEFGNDLTNLTNGTIIPSANYMMDSLIEIITKKGDHLRNVAEQTAQAVNSAFSGISGGTSESNGSSGGGFGKSFSGGGGHFALGGMVYASNGMFIPIGTDTVPAMLTPGEFVVNRKATQTIGARVLQQINSLDIPGALRSLMHRVPSLGGAPVINNTSNRDNHASVTQNFFNSGDDGFAYRRANRFVRALV